MATIETSKTYWNGNGEFQEEYNLLKKLVPPTGRAHTADGEAIRSISNIYYDLYNNGGGNLLECDEDGEYTEISDRTCEMINSIAKVCGKKFSNCDRLTLENIITDGDCLKDWQKDVLERTVSLVIRCVALSRIEKSVT